jgi:hypothetical protein
MNGFAFNDRQAWWHQVSSFTGQFRFLMCRFMVNNQSMGCTVRDPNPGRGKRFFASLKYPDRLLGPYGLLFNGHRGSFPAVRRPACDAEQSLPSSTQVTLSHYKPGQALRIPERWGSQISRNIPGTHFCLRLSRPQGHSATERIMSTKNSNDTIGNQTRNLPACSAVSQPTAPPRASSSIYRRGWEWVELYFCSPPPPYTFMAWTGDHPKGRGATVPGGKEAKAWSQPLIST